MFSEMRRGRQPGLTNPTTSFSGGIVAGSIEDLASPVNAALIPLPGFAFGGLANPYSPAQCNISTTTQARAKGRGNQYFNGLPLQVQYNHTLTPNSPFRDCTGFVGLMGHLAARSYHTGGVNVVLGDGSVRFASDNIDSGVWRGVGTRNGGEVLGEW